MSSPSIDYVGKAGDPATQGLGRLVGQYAKSTNLIALLQGVYEMGQDLELLFQKIGRMLDLNDDATQDTPNTDGAVGIQLRGIGNLVGVANVVPGPSGSITLTDAQYRLLVAARIYRNFVRGGTIPQLIEAIQILMPDLTTTGSIMTAEVGRMTTLVQIGRELADWEAGCFAIPSGISMTKGAILPRPDGVCLATYWWDTGCFTFATEADLGVLEDPTGEGFNTDESFTTGIGRWPEDF